MTQTFWTRYFRMGKIAAFIPLVEYLVLRTIWTFPLVFAMIAIPVLSIKCRSCGLHGYDHRIATHFRGAETLKDCPYCHEPMVEQA